MLNGVDESLNRSRGQNVLACQEDYVVWRSSVKPLHAICGQLSVGILHIRTFTIQVYDWQFPYVELINYCIEILGDCFLLVDILT